MDWRAVLGANIKRLRKARGWTQAQLAGESNISERHAAGIERGEENPTLDMLMQLASAFGVNVGELFDLR